MVHRFVVRDERLAEHVELTVDADVGLPPRNLGVFRLPPEPGR